MQSLFLAKLLHTFCTHYFILNARNTRYSFLVEKIDCYLQQILLIAKILNAKFTRQSFCLKFAAFTSVSLNHLKWTIFQKTFTLEKFCSFSFHLCFVVADSLDYKNWFKQICKYCAEKLYFNILFRNISNFCHLLRLKACNIIGKRIQRRCFPVKFTKFLWAPILKNICQRLLLNNFI